jgi:hypothetical protein
VQGQGNRELGKGKKEQGVETRGPAGDLGSVADRGDWFGGMGALAINCDVREGPGYFRIGDEGIGVEAPRMRT